MIVDDLIFDDRSRCIGIESILDADRDVLDTDRIDGRRIDDLRSKVAELHRLDVAQFVDGVSSLDHTGVGGHEAIHIGPYFKNLSVQVRCYDSRRIVGAASPEVGRLS